MDKELSETMKYKHGESRKKSACYRRGSRLLQFGRGEKLRAKTNGHVVVRSVEIHPEDDISKKSEAVRSHGSQSKFGNETPISENRRKRKWEPPAWGRECTGLGSTVIHLIYFAIFHNRGPVYATSR